MNTIGKDPSVVDPYARTIQSTDTLPNQALRKPETNVEEERVVISDAARSIQRVTGKIAELPDVRMDKVNELKNQIDSGTYQVDPEKVAEKMLKESFLNELL